MFDLPLDDDGMMGNPKGPELVVTLNNGTKYKLKMRVRRVNTPKEVRVIVTVIEDET